MGRRAGGGGHQKGQVAHARGGASRVGAHLEECRVDVVCDGAGKECLAGAGGAVEQTALGRLDAYAREELRVDEGQLDHLEGWGERAPLRRRSPEEASMLTPVSRLRACAACCPRGAGFHRPANFALDFGRPVSKWVLNVVSAGERCFVALLLSCPAEFVYGRSLSYWPAGFVLGSRALFRADLAHLADLLVESSHIGVGAIPLPGRGLRHEVCPHLSRQRAHDGERGHVQRHPCPLHQLLLVQFGPATHHVPRPGRGLHNVPLGVELAEHLADDLADRLKRLQVVLRLVVLLAQLLHLVAHRAHLRGDRFARGGGNTREGQTRPRTRPEAEGWQRARRAASRARAQGCCP
eukprot:scaffold14078_cov147-Isochrysis_galbana.AAC.2